MTKITREEILKIAHMSQLDIHTDEVESFISQIEQVLSYAERVKEVAATVQQPTNKNVNVFREDIAIPTDNESILAQAPEREGNYFVVPMILEGNE
jgi:aspartyl-tRNA(Asn)/glutamyl-tRNA(Gln) amidotransferase subunit C